MKRKLQKDAVYETVIKVLNENGVEFVEGRDVLFEVLDRDLRTEVIDNLIVQFKNDEIVLNKEYDEKGLRTYVGSLVSNWTKKDLRLNGDIAHEIKRPGSRIGQSDPMVRELRKMKIATKGSLHEEVVTVELKKRQEVLRKKQADSVVIDKQFIPDYLHHLLK